MIKNPIPKVTNKLQYRAIGIVNGVYSLAENDQANRGTLIDKQGKKIETVVLGKALSLIKKHINLKENYFWIVYPKNKNTQKLHLQIAGIWNPYQLNNSSFDSPKKDLSKLLEDLSLRDNYFSIRGELVYVNSQKKEFVIKICSSPYSRKSKHYNFKIVIKGDLSVEILNTFVSCEVVREDNTLILVSYEVIGKDLLKNNT